MRSYFILFNQTDIYFELKNKYAFLSVLLVVQDHVKHLVGV